MTIVGGTGALGFGLAVRLGLAGTPVVIGSRDAERAHQAAERAGAAVPSGQFSGAQNQDAVRGAELVILAVPFRSHSETLTNLKGALRPGQLLLDTTVPLAAAVSGKATRMLGVWQGSAAQQAQEMAPDGVAVVAAFHTVSAALLTDVSHGLDEDVLICGDQKAEKMRVAELVRSIDGLRPVDCGPLELARILESLTPLIIISKNVAGTWDRASRLTKSIDGGSGQGPSSKLSAMSCTFVGPPNTSDGPLGAQPTSWGTCSVVSTPARAG